MDMITVKVKIKVAYDKEMPKTCYSGSYCGGLRKSVCPYCEIVDASSVAGISIEVLNANCLTDG